jgi:hypothetical protein
MGMERRGGLPASDNRLDHSDVLVLRRQDGSFVAAFDAREVTRESILTAIKEDSARSVQAQAPCLPGLREDDARKATSANDDVGRSRLGEASRSAAAEDDRTRGDLRDAAGEVRRERRRVALPSYPPSEGGEEGADGRPIDGCGGSGLPSPPRERAEHIPKWHHGQVRWYNPMLEGFEWRGVPQTDEEALEVLGGSPNHRACAEAYREWRGLGASIKAALIRAGEAAETAKSRHFPAVGSRNEPG